MRTFPPVGAPLCNTQRHLVSSGIWTQVKPTLLGFQAPCRKLLNSALRGLELTVIQSDRDIYIPNCNTHGFYRKKQVRSPDHHPQMQPCLVYSRQSFILPRWYHAFAHSAAPPRARSVATAGVWTNWERRCPPVAGAMFHCVMESDGGTPGL